MVLNDRSQLATAKRIVVKVGSSSISGENESQLDALVDAIAATIRRGVEVILVSSGIGVPPISRKRRLSLR